MAFHEDDSPLDVGLDRKELLFKDEVYRIVGAALDVSNHLGPGFLDAVYQEALEIELDERRVRYTAQAPIQIAYKGRPLAKKFAADFLCYDRIVVEIKAIKAMTGADEAQLLNYLKATGLPLGLLINFGAPSLQWKHFANTRNNRIENRE